MSKFVDHLRSVYNENKELYDDSKEYINTALVDYIKDQAEDCARYRTENFHLAFFELRVKYQSTIESIEVIIKALGLKMEIDNNRNAIIIYGWTT